MKFARPAAAALAAVLILGPSALPAQQPPTNGPRRIDPGWHALVDARVIVQPGQVLESANIVIRDGRIVAVGEDVQPPKGARVWDLNGKTVCAAFVEPWLGVSLDDRPDPAAPGNHWNPEVMPQRSALDGGGPSEDQAKELRALGFGAAAAAPADGIFRGRAAVVSLEAFNGTDDGEESGEPAERPTWARDVFQAVGISRARDGYPRALMGIYALIRQTLLDADASFADRAASLDHLRGADLFLDARDELDILRWDRIRRTSRPLIPAHRTVVVGTGGEFRRVDAIARTKLPLILPLAFPDAPDIDTVEDQHAVTLSELWAWEQAPTTARRLLDAGVEVVLTTSKTRDRKKFFDLLRRAIAHGLTADEALRMLTTKPAALLGVGDRLGKVAAGYAANLLVLEGDDPFAKDTKRRGIWIRGRHHVLDITDEAELDGAWIAENLRIGDVEVAQLRFDGNKVEARSSSGKQASARVMRFGRRQLDFVVDLAKLDGDGRAVVHGVLQRGGGRMHGTVLAPSLDAPVAFTAVPGGLDTRVPESGGDEDAADAAGGRERSAEPTEHVADASAPLWLPFGAYGRPAEPAPENVVFTEVTAWTADEQGIVENAAVWIRDGKIAYVGPMDGMPAEAKNADVTPLPGHHVTPGLIDCHSHTGISGGVNEGTETVTAEVRIADALDPDDVNWYRQLAGGITAVNQLHGSANPIGGQNHVVKLRWGASDPWEMTVDTAPQGIKFALGENVKRSRSQRQTRYPATRMGVEAVMRDRFRAARDYQRLKALARLGTHPMPRIDLELEALAEILDGTRLIHCHSYRQDEILMLCRVADDFGFRIGTFQHGLECYKVAEAVRRSAIGASIFSDWWAYKMEVFDAIPHSGSILERVGVNTSFNSDSSELARRMNTEATKAVKYGDLDPNVALQFVTRNPAIQLKIDDRTGSLREGKDADVVVWNRDPLSTFARCMITFVDGRRMFDHVGDEELQIAAREQKQRLLAVVAAAGGGGGGRGGATSIPGFGIGADEWNDWTGECGDCGLAAHARLQEQREARSREETR